MLGEVVYGRQRSSWRKWTGVDQPALLPAAEPLIVITKKNFERNCDCLCSRVCLYLCLCLCLFLCLCAFVCACVYMSESVVSVSVCACVRAYVRVYSSRRTRFPLVSGPALSIWKKILQWTEIFSEGRSQM